MKKFKSSDLTHKRAEVLAIAEDSGALIQLLKTNGEILKEFVIVSKEEFLSMDTGFDKDGNGRVYPEDF